MPPSRKDQSSLTRAVALAWLDRRINYERAIPQKISAGTFGLARMRRLLAAIGAPQQHFPVVHVAGTKGKGSTVAMIAAILAEAGHTVGRYMSPHVHNLEERIAINDRAISASDLVNAFRHVMPAVDAMDRIAEKRDTNGPTWFEIMTAIAMVHFARKKVPIAVIETGLGGRLDATNTAQPILSIITSISLDHMATLGTTIEQIAAEKAGIIKRGCTVISGVNNGAASDVIAATATQRRAPLLQLERDFQAEHRRYGTTPLTALSGGELEFRRSVPGQATAPLRFRIGMPGRHQATNAALAVMAAQQLEAHGFHLPLPAIARALQKVHLPARIETLCQRPLVVVDAAHNVASMQALIETLEPILAAFCPRVLVFAASNDKQIEAMLAAATDQFEHVVVTRYATNPRAATLQRLTEACIQAGWPQPHAAHSPQEALHLAQSLATPQGFVCIAGSFFLASEIGSYPGTE